MPMNEIDSMHSTNLQALANLPRQELELNLGKYGLFVNGQLIGYFATNREAIVAARQSHQFGQFSVQRIETQPVELGVASCADYPR